MDFKGHHDVKSLVFFQPLLNLTWHTLALSLAELGRLWSLSVRRLETTTSSE